MLSVRANGGLLAAIVTGLIAHGRDAAVPS